eukprot:3936199-Rhodomonas_salina.2
MAGYKGTRSILIPGYQVTRVRSWYQGTCVSDCIPAGERPGPLKAEPAKCAQSETAEFDSPTYPGTRNPPPRFGPISRTSVRAFRGFWAVVSCVFRVHVAQADRLTRTEVR